ncbi:MAG TPA: ATP-binding cassette domain-containing protein [Umezawaea sp.]|nr:ATP-binding cassette domain-containing protein [Umezawaea sp.]
MTAAQLTATGLGHTYTTGTGTHTALREVTFTVAPGELLCIVGPSGCGKTTLLRALAGLLAPTLGTVTFDGHPLRAIPAGVAIVTQDYSRSLPAWLTAASTIDLVLDRSRHTRVQRREHVARALHEVGLTAAARKRPAELSGGMQQRVAIARALATRPRLLLMDEPFASVDAQTRFELEDLLLRVRAEHAVSTVVITHDLDEAVYLGDRVVVLSGTPATVLDELVIDLPQPREQIRTRETEAFVTARTHIARLLISAASQRPTNYRGRP